MFSYIKRYFILQKYNEYGELMGEVLSGQLVISLNDYFILKQKYITSREKIEKIGLLPAEISHWVRYSGGWSKKYPKIKNQDDKSLDELKFLYKNDLLELENFESKRYKQV